jgi:hypothetical protein
MAKACLSPEEQLCLFLTDPITQQDPVSDEAGSEFQETFSDPSSVEPPSAEIDAPCDQPATDCAWASFLRTHGRVPTIVDSMKPWEYRGWLLYYRLLLEEHPSIPKRWDYWCRTMSTGRLLDEAIPAMCFGECTALDAIKPVERWVTLVSHHESSSSAMDCLLDWFLWGLGLSSRKPRFSADLNELLYREVDLGPLLLRPYDCLGEWIAMQKGPWNPHAFYPTPHAIVEMMVRMQLGDLAEDLRLKTVCDPCVGSGRMLLHASNYCLRLFGTDIDPLVVKICKINGALYAPWMVRPFPEAFFVRR